MPPAFFVLHEGDRPNTLARLEVLRAASTKQDVELHSVDSLAINFARIAPLRRGDLFYNCGRGSARLETVLIRPDLATIYVTPPALIHDVNDTTIYAITHERLGLPAPRTVHRLCADPKRLADYVEFLGGFPVVVKVVGGTLGLGTMLIDSFGGLVSAAEFLTSRNDEFILRQYIPAREVGRLVVLGTKVIASNRKHIGPDGFRTQAHLIAPEAATYSPAIQELAVTAARSTNREFAGVDILIGRDDQPYLLEVNAPHDFVTTQRVTGIPVADLVVEFLLAKSAALVATSPHRS